MHILLADDDEDDRTFFSEAIQELKMNNKLTLKDGNDLMDYLVHPEIKLPHVLFLDLNMPEKQVLIVLKKLDLMLVLKMFSAIYSTSSSEKILKILY
jgi:CheY-like chemotaxis protein